MLRQNLEGWLGNDISRAEKVRTQEHTSEKQAVGPTTDRPERWRQWLAGGAGEEAELEAWGLCESLGNCHFHSYPCFSPEENGDIFCSKWMRPPPDFREPRSEKGKREGSRWKTGGWSQRPGPEGTGSQMSSLYLSHRRLVSFSEDPTLSHGRCLVILKFGETSFKKC